MVVTKKDVDKAYVPELVVKNLHVLTNPCIAFPFDQSFKNSNELAIEMLASVMKYGGAGLSANQIGYPWRVLIMRAEPENVCAFNPKIVGFSDEQETLEEACLSWPGLVFKVKRSKHIRVRFTMANGEVVTHKYTGLTARVFQHEYEHLEGKLFFSNISKLKLKLAIKHAKTKGHDYTDMKLLKYALDNK